MAIPERQLTQAQLDQGVRLDGLWQFTGPDHKVTSIQVPDSWEKHYGRRFPYFGTGFYRLKVLLPPQSVGHILELNSFFVSGNRFRFWVNGKLVGHNGSRPGSLSRVPYYEPFRVDSPQLLIEAEVDNQILHFSGLVQSLWLGEIKTMDALRLREKMGLNLVIGIFLFLGAFHLLIYAGFRQDKAFLWFGILCLGAGVYGEFFQAHNLEYLLLELPVEWSLRWTRLGLYSMIPAFLWYAYYISPNYISNRFLKFVTWINLGFIASLLLPGRWYSPLTNFWFLTMFVCIIYNLYQLLRYASLREVRPFLLSGMVFSAAAINDMLNAASLVHTGFIGRYGFLFFCFTQAGFLAWRLQKSFQQSQTLQAELVEVNHNLDDLVSERTQEVRAQNDELQELVKFKDEMTQMLVHDLKAPLNALINLPANPNPETQERIQHVGAGMLGMIDGMLKVSAAEQAGLSLQLSPQNLRALAQRVLAGLDSWAQSKKIMLENALGSEFNLMLDADLFERVLQNLLDNAIKHSPVGGSIRLDASTTAGQLQFWIEDSGPGIPAELTERIFENKQSYAQGETPRSSGLGLFFCRQVVEAHAGTLRVQNGAGGARFIMSLPWSPPHETEPIWGRTPAWTADQLAVLSPLADDLAQTQVYALSRLQRLLEPLEATVDPVIQAWRQALLRAIQEVDEKSYAQLIAQISASPDR